MPQVSKKPLPKDLEKEMFRQLWSSISKVKNPITASEFFSDLLTKTEKIMLSKRFTIAILLIREKSPTDIKNAINVSFSTIGSVAGWVKNARPHTKNILQSLSKNQNWQGIIDKIEELLDTLPPQYHTDWGKEAMKKRKRAWNRSIKKSLR